MARRVEATYSWHDSIQIVLRRAKVALSCKEIADRISQRQLRSNIGATPAQTVAAVIAASLKDSQSPYVRVSRGLYNLSPDIKLDSSLDEEISKNGNEIASEEIVEHIDEVSETGALQAFGMFWRRDLVIWSGEGKLTGKQREDANDVNFAKQVGVYLLHDRDKVVYVGRAGDTLFSRLKAHTTDRLNGRWDRFSWFGLRKVNEDGNLSDANVPWNQEVVIETMEALLIESLEPPLNRRRGDNFSASEYLQVPDSKIESNRRQEFMKQIEKVLDQK